MKVEERFPSLVHDFRAIFECATCGAAVIDREKHNEWHNDLERERNETVENI